MCIMENVILYTCLHMTVANSTSPPTEIPTNGTTTVYCSSGYYCYNGGTCNGSYSCICPDGYQGYDCSRRSCEYSSLDLIPSSIVVHYLFLHCVSSKGEGLCTNNGTCSYGYCYCPFGYSGKYCELGGSKLLYICICV